MDHRFDRLAFCRTAGLTGAGVVIGSKYLGEAFAMESRVYSSLPLDSRGIIHAGGPIWEWDSDEISAQVSVVIAQKSIVTQGLSGRVNQSASHWSALCKPNKLLVLGLAQAQATAVVLLSNGQTEWYNWDVGVTLTHA